MTRRRGSGTSPVRLDVQPDPENAAQVNDNDAGQQSVSDTPYIADNDAGQPSSVSASIANGEQVGYDSARDEKVVWCLLAEHKTRC